MYVLSNTILSFLNINNQINILIYVLTVKIHQTIDL